MEVRRHDYRRHGTTSLFAASNVKTGELIAQWHQLHLVYEFRKVKDTMKTNVSPELDVPLILDNYGTHKTALIHRWLFIRPRFHGHSHPRVSHG
ncbi:MAG: hypothetical protein KIT39_08405 [Nitrospirales bacterium]|nr:hypothetical protein [Nitrospirales bacterium]